MQVSLQSESLESNLKCSNNIQSEPYTLCFLLSSVSGLATLGIDVSLVSTGGAKPKNKQGMQWFRCFHNVSFYAFHV